MQLVAVVLVVALLGGAYVYYTSLSASTRATTSLASGQSTEIVIPGSGGTTSHSTSQTSTSSTALTIVSSTTVPCTSSTTAGGGPASLPDYVPLFVSINQMTMVAEQVTVDRFGRTNTSSAQVGFKVVGQTAINSTKVYEVNLQVTIQGANGTSSTNQALAYFDQDGNLVLASRPNLNLTGSAAVALVAPYLNPFNYELTSNAQLASYKNPDIEKTLNQTTVTLGSTIMNVTFAEPKALPYSITVCNQTTIVESVLFAYGVIPGADYPIVTYYYSLGTDGVNRFGFGYKILTVTRA